MNKIITAIAGLLLLISSCSENKMPKNDETVSPNFADRLKKSQDNFTETINDSIKLIILVEEDSSRDRLLSFWSVSPNDTNFLFQKTIHDYKIVTTQKSPKRTILLGGIKEVIINHSDLSIHELNFKDYSGEKYLEKIEAEIWPVAKLTIYTDSLLENFRISNNTGPNDFPCGSNPVEDIIPEGFKLINSFEVDLDNDSSNEVLIHCLSNKRVECELIEDSSCFMDVLLLVKTEPEWHIVKQFNVPKPASDSDHEINLVVDSNKSIVLKFNYAPANPSNVSTTQFYSFSRNELILESLTHTVGTRMGTELLWWVYNFNFRNNLLEFHSSKQDYDHELEEEINTSIDTIILFHTDSLKKISQPISIENLIPEGIEEPYF